MVSGSKPGERRGGRQKGTPNKEKQNVRHKALEAGLTPRDYLLGIMRDETKEEAVRMRAAESVAKYMHPALSSISANVTEQDSIPLAERLKSYSRTDAIDASDGKVVTLRKAEGT